MDDHANKTQTHRTAARGGCSCGGYRQCAGRGRRRTCRTGSAVSAQPILRATGRRRIQMRITGQRSAERRAAGHQFLPSRRRLTIANYDEDTSVPICTCTVAESTLSADTKRALARSATTFGGTNLGDHEDFRGVERCNRLGTNVIPGTARYLLGCSCGQELVRSVVHNDIDTFAR